MKYLSLDPGATYTKAQHGERHVRFPSVLERCAPGQGICVGGAHYLAGEDAMSAQAEVDGAPQRGDSFHGSETQLVLLCEAMRRLGLGAESDRELEAAVVALPYVVTCDAAHAAQVASVQNFARQFAWTEPDGSPRHVRVKRVVTPPQGGGALWQHTHALLRAGEATDGRYYVVVDIGGQTSDVVLVRLGARLGAETVLRGSSASIGVNVEELFYDLAEDLKAKPYAMAARRRWDYHSVMGLVERGATTLRMGPNRQIDFSEDLARCRRLWTAKLQRAVRRVLGNRWHDLSGVLLTGGGAALVDAKEWDGPVQVMDCMSNVRGQLLYLEDQP